MQVHPDTPRFIQGYDLTLDDRLVLPRGLRHTIAAIVERAGSRLVVTDIRNSGTEIDSAFTAELISRQADAVGALLAHDTEFWLPFLALARSSWPAP